ncbi:MAG TPA: EAL domain-containing protein, partial [Gammaproteobacteria bacterium]|nr:EAL domain-containing protein [Gammaproteobacteria bacterium]
MDSKTVNNRQPGHLRLTMICALATAGALLLAFGFFVLLEYSWLDAATPNYQRFWAYTAFALAMAVLVRLIIYISLNRPGTQRQLPADLLEPLQRILRERNYDLRLPQTDNNPSPLTSALNELLANMQQRETHLREHRRVLTERISSLSNELRSLQGRLRSEIQQRRRAQAESAKLNSALTHAADAVMVTNKAGEVEFVNPAFESITGYTLEQIVGSKPDILRSDQHDTRFFTDMWKIILKGDVFRGTVVNKRHDGTLYHEEKTITPLKDSRGRITHFISTGKDISDRIKVQEKLEYLAHHDAVTGLPNRILLSDRVDQALVRARRDGRGVAVLFLDLDGFKAINDTVGHHVGDQFLAEVAARIQISVRERDTVARMGGDEFAVVLEGLHSMSAVSKIARKVLSDLATPFHLEDNDLYVTGSIGVSRYPSDGEDVQTLLRKADSAMYRAKQSGKNNHKFFSQVQGEEDLQRLELEQQLRRAVERKEFIIHYQPQVSIDTSTVVGVEALLRWQHPKRGLVDPINFISVLEETGLILEVGEWVLQEACAQACAWEAAGLPPVRMAVNLSSKQFLKRDLVGSIARILDKTGLPPKQLNIEITEGTLASKFDFTVDLLKKLTALGVTISVDDFGVGYSSLNYLKRFPINKLKIDQSFVRDVTHDSDDAAIASAIIALAHNLRLDVIAEGV